MENNSPEQNKPRVENIGKIIDFSRRMQSLYSDPDVKEAAIAGIRTILNFGITIVDAIPNGPGEIPDVLASISKTLKRHSGQKSDSSKFDIFDLTPDVPTSIPWLSQILEIPTLGAAPSYLIPTALQLGKDIPRMKKGFERAKEILADENTDYIDNQDDINKAIKVFNSK
jgi:hypothetical protein